MFGDRYYAPRFYGNRYFGPTAGGGGGPPASGQSRTRSRYGRSRASAVIHGLILVMVTA